MKSLWVATGVIVGLGVAGLFAANTGESRDRTINVGNDSGESTSTSESLATTTTDGEDDTASASIDGEPQNTSTTTAPRQIVNAATPVAPPPPDETTAAPLATFASTTTEHLLHNIGDPCETVGDTARRDGYEVPMVCVAGSPNTWQRI